MPIGAITMIFTNVGLQIYNNWCSSRQNTKLQEKREEFECAARERNTEHMWKLMREGQELTMQLEKEKHDDRLKELKDEVDHLLERLTYEATISNWPLKVLPIVMKNQAFGNLLANQEEHVAMHVILTRSNYNEFNKSVFPIVEKQLEQYCDQHWSTMTDHPVLFYSGAWKPMSSPTDVQVTAMREELKNLPTLLITPFFRPGDGKLVFQVHMWGVGANSSDQFIVPEIEPVNDEFHFQRTYNNQQDYENEEGLLDEMVEDLVPYLECMIGYMADTYFWSSFGYIPQLPRMLTNGTINTDGMKYLVDDAREYYDLLLLEGLEKAMQQPFADDNFLNLYDGASSLWDKTTQTNKLEKIFLSYCEKIEGKKFDSFNLAKDDCIFNENDTFIKNFKTLYPEEFETKHASFVSSSYQIDEFPANLFLLYNYQELDLLNDVLKKYHFDIELYEYYLLLIKKDNRIITHVIDKEGIIHICSPSYDTMINYEKLKYPRKIKEFFEGRERLTIPINKIEFFINELNIAYKSQAFTF